MQGGLIYKISILFTFLSEFPKMFLKNAIGSRSDANLLKNVTHTFTRCTIP